ncbi:MAG: YfhO family protein, partial [Candidatus Andersenbacteria bacterium]
ALLYQDNDQPSHPAYFVRTPDPTPRQWELSRKEAVVIVEPLFPKQVDEEIALLARHLNVVADSSSARWIGALSLREYRAFIEFFLANDQDPIDGDGLHAIQRHRQIVDMLGITHLAQIIPLTHEDGMLDEGFELVENVSITNKRGRLYENPQAYPKAFMVKHGVWKPAADEIRDRMRLPQFDPRKIVYLGGPKPPKSLEGVDWEAVESQAVADTSSLKYSATIDRYSATEIELTVETNEDAWLVLTDSTTPQWHTTIDEQPAPYYIAYSTFKAAYIPAGTHQVSFTYHSPAIEQSKKISLGGLGLVLVLGGVGEIIRRSRKIA